MPSTPFSKDHLRGHLRVSPRHRIYWEVHGNPKGIPLFVCNGGPGQGFSSGAAERYDQEQYRVVLFDQRGSGRSLPTACLVENTTADMLGDIEKLMAHLAIKKAVFTGGSWGATLALLQGVTRPERVLAVVAHGIFLGTREDIDWLYRGGTKWNHPEAWDRFISVLPPDEREDPIEAYGRRMTAGSQASRDRHAVEWTLYEHRLLDGRNEYTYEKLAARIEELRPLCLIENHFMRHDCFLLSDHLVRRGGRLADIPVVLLHGRHDSVCPPRNAWRLHRAIPGSRLKIVPDSGHGTGHVLLREAYEEAMARMAERLTAAGKSPGSGRALSAASNPRKPDEAFEKAVAEHESREAGRAARDGNASRSRSSVPGRSPSGKGVRKSAGRGAKRKT